MNRIFTYVFSILFLIFGLWIIAGGVQAKNLHALKTGYHTFQEITYKQAYFVNKVYLLHRGNELSKDDLNRISLYLADLEEKKNQLYSEIGEFPESLSEIKEHSKDLYDQSEILINLFESDYEGVCEEESLGGDYMKVLKAAIKDNPDCAINTKSIRREIEGRSWTDDLIDGRL